MKRAYVVGAAWLDKHCAAFERLDHELLAFDFNAAAVRARGLISALGGVAFVEIEDETLDSWFDDAKRENPIVAKLLASTHLDATRTAALTTWLDARAEASARHLVSACRSVEGSCLVFLESDVHLSSVTLLRTRVLRGRGGAGG